MGRDYSITGADITARTDLVLKRRNLKRKALTDYAGVTSNSFTQYSKKGTVPGAGAAFRFCEMLGVDFGWLIAGINPTAGWHISPEDICRNIFSRIMEKYFHDGGADAADCCKFLSDIVSADELEAWRLGQKTPDLDTLVRIADKIGCSLDDLTGRSADNRITEKETGLEEKIRRLDPEDIAELELIVDYRLGLRKK